VKSVKMIWTCVLVLLIVPLAHAQTLPQAVPTLETKAEHVILIEEATGDTLFAKDPDASMATSSMSKVMTMYMVFEAIKNGKLKLDDKLKTSERAWKQEGSRMFLNVGDEVTVQDLIRGVIVQSGNDAAVVLAEAIGGTEDRFADMMNLKAQELGMARSFFKNASGLPDPEHFSTARDLATLAIATIRNFPEDYRYYAEIDFTYNNIKQGNRNPLLYRNIGVDGLKTGHTKEAGFGLMASALRNGRRLVIVANGMKNMQERADETAKILEWGYREFGLYHVLKQDNEIAAAKVWLGTKKTVPLVSEKNILLSMPKNKLNDLKVTISFEQPVAAPIAKGQILGKAIVEAPGKEKKEVPLLANEEVAQLGFFDRIKLKVKLFLGQL